MKKLLNLIGALTLCGSVGTTVAACSPLNPKDPAQQLIDKVKGANITVPVGTPKAISAPQTQTAIRKALEAVKKINITPQEANDLSFSGPNLVAGKQVQVNVKATVSGQTKKGTIEVTLTINPAQNLINKVNDANIIVSAYTPTKISDSHTQTAIRNALVEKVKSLTPQEASELSFSGTNPLVAGQKVKVTVTANVSGKTATGMIDVTLKAKTPAQKLIDKVNGANITVPSTTPTAILDSKTQTAIRNALVEKVKSLTPKEASELSFSGSKPLATKQPVPVTVTANVSGQTALGTIIVTLSSENPAQDIADKITNTQFTLPVGTGLDVTKKDTMAALNKALVAINPGIKNVDPNDFSYAGGPLEIGRPHTITIKVTFIQSGQTYTSQPKNLQVKVLSKADVVINKITKKEITVPHSTNPDVNNPATVNTINTWLQQANSTLTAADLKTLHYSNGPLKNGQEVAIKVTSTIAARDDSTTLKITLQSNPAIDVTNKIKNVNISIPFVTDPHVTNPTTVGVINTALQKANPTLTANDLKTLSYSGGPLIVGTSVPVRLTSKIDKQTSSKTLTIFLAKPHTPEAYLLRDKIKNLQFALPNNVVGASAANVQKSVYKYLLINNKLLTKDDEAHFVSLQQKTSTLAAHDAATFLLDLGGFKDGSTAVVTLTLTPQQSASYLINRIKKVTPPSYMLVIGQGQFYWTFVWYALDAMWLFSRTDLNLLESPSKLVDTGLPFTITFENKPLLEQPVLSTFIMAIYQP